MPLSFYSIENCISSLCKFHIKEKEATEQNPVLSNPYKQTRRPLVSCCSTSALWNYISLQPSLLANFHVQFMFSYWNQKIYLMLFEVGTSNSNKNWDNISSVLKFSKITYKRRTLLWLESFSRYFSVFSYFKIMSCSFYLLGKLLFFLWKKVSSLLQWSSTRIHLH